MNTNPSNSQATSRSSLAPEPDGLPLSALTDAMGACTGYDPGPDPNYDDDPIPPGGDG